MCKVSHPNKQIMTSRIIAAATALTLLPVLPAQEMDPITFKANVKYISVPVTVLDKDGNFVSGLEPKDFRVLDNRKPQPISEDIAFNPISLVVAIQANAGIEGMLPKINKIGSLLDSLVVGETGEAAVVKFDHRVEVLQGFTNESQKITQAIAKIKPGSSTARLNDAVMESINMLRNKSKDRRRVILLIAETRDRGSEIKAREVLLEAQFKDVIIYTVNVSRFMSTWTRRNPDVPRPPAIPAAAGHSGMVGGGAMNPNTQMQNSGYANGNVLPAFVEIFRQAKALFIDNPAEAYTKFTGGREYGFINEGGLERAISNLGNELHSQYLLSYRVPEDAAGGFHEIEVKVMRPDLEVRSRPGYWIAGPGEEKPRK
jgi:VWFA-related protein